MAAAIIRGAGLERYYQDREEFAPRPGPLRPGWDAVPVTLCEDGSAEVRLVLDGLRCASCVWVTEHILQATPGVEEATVSYATGRASLRWDPEAVDLGTLAGKVAALGYRPRLLGEESKPDQGLVIRLGVATFAAMNIMLMSAALYLGWVSAMEDRYAALFRWASLLLATPVALWCAEPFFSGAIQGLKNRVLHMDLPIALAVAVLYVHGFVATVMGTDTYLDSLAMLVALLLAGRMLEGRGRRRAAEAAVSLAAALPATARRRVGDSVEVVPAADLAPGDLIDVGPGEEFAADGVVAEGEATVRLALITGEAEPVVVSAGNAVVSGAVLVDGALTVRVERTGDETTLHVATSRGPRAFRIAVSESREGTRTFTDLATGHEQTVQLREFRLRIMPADPEQAGEGFLRMEGETEIWVEAESKAPLEISGKVPRVPGRVQLRLVAMG